MVPLGVQTKAGFSPLPTVAGLDFGTIELNKLTGPTQTGLVKDALQMGHLLELNTQEANSIKA